jgi:hypothetical protein
MSEYDFMLNKLIKIIRASDLDSLAKQILIHRLIETFELTETYVEEKRYQENQKKFVKEVD